MIKGRSHGAGGQGVLNVRQGVPGAGIVHDDHHRLIRTALVDRRQNLVDQVEVRWCRPFERVADDEGGFGDGCHFQQKMTDRIKSCLISHQSKVVMKVDLVVFFQVIFLFKF